MYFDIFIFLSSSSIKEEKGEVDHVGQLTNLTVRRKLGVRKKQEAQNRLLIF